MARDTVGSGRSRAGAERARALVKEITKSLRRRSRLSMVARASGKRPPGAMPQIFHHSTNTLSRVSIFGAVFAFAAFLWLLALVGRSGYWTRQTQVLEQPVPFSHQHHVGGLGIDCRYCHTTVETAAFAGMPPTATCMNCHAQIWADSPMLEPVRESWKSGRSLEWVRVHKLADFVYFNHSIHINKGVGCSTCHGRVDEMPLIRKEHTLYMEWCLECHRAPEKFVRPRDQVYNMEYEAPANQLEVGRRLVAEYKIQKLIDCYTCHR